MNVYQVNLIMINKINETNFQKKPVQFPEMQLFLKKFFLYFL